MMAVGFQDVSKHYRGRPAVTEFTLQVQPEERLVLLGPSGCGKTTVLRLLAGLVAPDRGRIDINGEVVAKDGRNLKGPEERNLGMVFQAKELIVYDALYAYCQEEVNAGRN